MKPMYYGIPFSPQATLTDTIGAADTIITQTKASSPFLLLNKEVQNNGKMARY